MSNKKSAPYLYVTLALLALTPVPLHAQIYDFDLRDSLDRSEYTIRQPLADGNWRVTVTLGHKKRAGRTTIFAENRRMMLNDVATGKKQTRTMAFTVNKHSAAIDGNRSVRLKPSEANTPNWDDDLSLVVCGGNQAVQHIRMERDTTAQTIFLCGNSTVTDQDFDPWCSWGQIITQWLGPEVAVCNLAVSGETASGLLASGKMDKAVTMMKPGDIVMAEFGHNDQKQKGPGMGAWYNYSTALKSYIDMARANGATPVLVTPTRRRFFDKEGKVQDTHGDYPEAMREVARREGTALIELQEMTGQLYEALGVEGSKAALVHYPANTFPQQEKALADNTHFNPYGATEVAKCVMQGLRQLQIPLAGQIRDTFPTDYSPSHPADPAQFVWPTSKNVNLTKPEGN